MSYLELSRRIQEKKPFTMIKDRYFFTSIERSYILSYLENYLGPIYMRCFTGNEGHPLSRVNFNE